MIALVAKIAFGRFPMVSPETLEIVRRAQLIYNERLREKFEPTHKGQFLCIEPDSGDYFLGRRMEEASAAARKAYPNRVCHIIRIGFPAAVEFGYSP
jgi:hypothetical protein